MDNIKELSFITAMKGCQQDSVFHAEGDVYTHTEMVAQAGLDLAMQYNLPAKQIEALALASYLHDVGKPMTYKFEGGKHSSPKHAQKGAEFIRHWMWEGGSKMPLNDQNELVGLIRLHAWPIRFLEREVPEETAIKASYLTNNKLLGLLAMADMKGRICQDKIKQASLYSSAQIYLDCCEAEGCLEKPYEFYNDHTRVAYFAGECSATSQIYDACKFDVTLMVGLPCSGKDYWLEKNYDNLFISRDRLRAIHKDRDEGFVLQRMTEKIKTYAANKEDFAINATNLRKELRMSFIKLIRAYGGRVNIVYCHANKDELLKRNKKRNENLTFKEQVPDSAILNMAKGFQPPDLTECHSLLTVSQ